MPTFGVSAVDGTLAKCKAKPENRGRGSCPHGEHVELEGPMAMASTIDAYNEERLAEHFGGATPAPVKKAMPKPPPPRPVIQAHPSAGTLTAEEFDEATKGIADAFPQDSWELLNDFYDNFSTLLQGEGEGEEMLRISKLEATEKVTAYLESDDPVAVKVREYLGPEVSPADFSAILVNDVRAMTARSKLRNGPKTDSFNRIMLTSVANDMNKQRYVASVLFFGGRCCYCDCVMSKHPGPKQATGEHITPLNPEDPNAPIGATRYGNMAMACSSCNNDRGNKDLKTWLRETDCVKPEQKPHSMARIEAFRRFALYEEFTPKQSALLRKIVEHTRNDARSRTRKDGYYSEKDFEGIQVRMKARIYDLQQMLQATS